MEEDLIIEEVEQQEVQEEVADGEEVIEELPEGEELVEEFDTVSDGDSTEENNFEEAIAMLNQAVTYDNDALYDIRSDVQVLVDSSLQGYLSSSIVSVFDRLVDGGNYRYYVAFRGVNEDSNAGTLYLSNECSGNQLSNCQVVRMYRVHTGNNYDYNYYYDVSYDDVESFNFGNGALYYTNISSGYPSLGSAKTDKVLLWLPILAVTMFLGCLMIRRKIKEC